VWKLDFKVSELRNQISKKVITRVGGSSRILLVVVNPEGEVVRAPDRTIVPGMVLS